MKIIKRFCGANGEMKLDYQQKLYDFQLLFRIRLNLDHGT
jgi:hypothetical protein